MHLNITRTSEAIDALEVIGLPTWAKVTLALRCVQRLGRILPDTWKDDLRNERWIVEGAIDFVNSASRNAYFPETRDELRKTVESAAARVHGYGYCKSGSTLDESDEEDLRILGEQAGSAVRAIAYSLLADSTEGLMQVISEVSTGVTYGPQWGHQRDIDYPDRVAEIRRDIEILKVQAHKHKWADATPVSTDVFLLDHEEDQSLTEVASVIHAMAEDLCKLVAKSPDALDEIEWRDLERMIAQTLEAIGFSVTLTPPAKDGGKDVVARCSIENSTRVFYVEIKHWRKGDRPGADNPFGPSPKVDNSSIRQPRRTKLLEGPRRRTNGTGRMRRQAPLTDRTGGTREKS